MSEGNMGKISKRLCFLVCRHFIDDVKAVLEAGNFADVRTAALPASCGKIPLSREEILQAAAQAGTGGEDFSLVHVFCGCCTPVSEPAQPLSPPIPAHFQFHKLGQCFYLLAPPGLIDGLIKSGAYLISPGWLVHWREHLEEWGLGRNQVLAREFFRDHISRLVLLDTGIDSRSAAHIKEFAGFVDCPFEIVPIGLEFLRLFLEKFILEWRLEKLKAWEPPGHTASDYAMAMDLLTTLTQSVNEGEVIRNMLQLFIMLYASGELVYVPVTEGTPGKPVFSSPPGSEAELGLFVEDARALEEEYRLTGSGKGFWIRIACESETCGVLKIDKVMFPEYLDHYLNLALTIGRVCGLAIANARKYQQIMAQKNQLADTLRALEKKEAQLSASLHEKETLLQEIHHRVKNNMMVISSLLNIQASSLEDPRLTEILRQTRFRIRTMAMVHECVYQSKDLTVVDFNLYAREIANSLLMTSDLQVGKIQLNLDIGDVSLEVKQAIPCGLIINELLTNAIKHAFPPGLEKKGNIHVSVQASPFGNVKIMIRDNGRGLPGEIDVFTPTTMGLRLVQMMVKQLKAELKVYREEGTAFKLTFPLKLK